MSGFLVFKVRSLKVNNEAWGLPRLGGGGGEGGGGDGALLAVKTKELKKADKEPDTAVSCR